MFVAVVLAAVLVGSLPDPTSACKSRLGRLSPELCADYGKVYTDVCELADELIAGGLATTATVSQWICIINHESGYRTFEYKGPDADGSYNHGLFSINDKYWCDNGSNDNHACHVDCDNLHDNDITDDIACAKIIYEVHGYNAWVAWTDHCVNTETSGYVDGCTFK